ncbi:hypothetical protein ACVWXO_008261 [Bradyrhizobium sp. LM2.7]
MRYAPSIVPLDRLDRDIAAGEHDIKVPQQGSSAARAWSIKLGKKI